jgi:hypothetical protein
MPVWAWCVPQLACLMLLQMFPVQERLYAAKDLTKPFVPMSQTGYTDRQSFLTDLQQAANEADAAATLVWQVYAWPIESQDSYNFDWSQPGNEAIRSQIEVMKERVRQRSCPFPCDFAMKFT